MEVLFAPENIVALLTLIFLEIVLGVDNVIFISIVSNKLPVEQQAKTRNLGLALALIFRLALLFSITWIIGFTEPLFTVFEFEFSTRDLILFVGGIFLIYKSTVEIHHKMEGEHDEQGKKGITTMFQAIVQIVALDLIFSFDSILTAIGLVEEVILMVVAVVVAIIVMMVFAGRIAEFIKSHPTLEVLALSFLILIGFMLMIEAFEYHVPKGYIYFAVFFSLLVEVLNIRIRRRRTDPVKLHKRYEES